MIPMDSLIASASIYDILSYNISTLSLSCLAAETIDKKSLSFCNNLVEWKSARLYNSSSDGYYISGSPMSIKDQDIYAKYISYQYLYNGNTEIAIQSFQNNDESKLQSLPYQCNNLLKAISCIKAFPSCPISGTTISSVSYLRPCKLQCQQLQDRCQSSFTVNCDNPIEYPITNCAIHVLDGYFILSPQQGPYDHMSTLYAVIFACWISFAILWYFLAFIYFYQRCLQLSQAIILLPIVKTIVIAIGLAFWILCDKYDMCSYWLGITFLNIHLVYETSQMLVFILIAKGWTVVHDILFIAEWRIIIAIISLFYMINSILLVIQGSISIRDYGICITLLYGYMYSYILYHTCSCLRIIHSYTSKFSSNMSGHITNPLKYKLNMYIYFLLLVFVSITIEIIVNILMSYPNTKFQLIMFIYEISNVIICFLMGYLFRPKGKVNS